MLKARNMFVYGTGAAALVGTALFAKQQFYASHLVQAEEHNLLTRNAQVQQLMQEYGSNPDWVKVEYNKTRDTDQVRNYLRSKHQGTLDNKKFEYVVYFNATSRKLVAIFYCGTHVQGPPNGVHGGATATVLDAAMGTLAWQSGLYAVTANLNVNYRKFIPLKSIVMCEANVSKLDGRKVYIDAQVKSLDGAIVHADATALFIQIDASKLPKKQ